MGDFYTLAVSSVAPLTPNAVALTFNVPDTLKEKFNFIAGQYITVKKTLNGSEIRRAYSISSSPSSGKLTIGIKKIQNGIFSTYANESIKVGDVLEVMPPEGRFMFQPHLKAKTIGAFAAGSGITPIISIAQTVMESHDTNRFVLVYGNQSPEESMYREDLFRLQKKYTNRFFIQWVYSRSNEPDCLFGRIENATVNLVLKNKFKEFNFDAFYLCGPEQMITTVSDTLENNSIPKEHIHFELFTSSKTILGGLEGQEGGHSKLSVVLDDDEHQFMMDQKELVLDALLKNDIDAPYSCYGGVCSSCIARVVEGKAEMIKNQILTDSEINEGYILTCQALPTTPFLKIDFDDV
ncbi:MAG: ferredoxin--NADP reductase [Bacteroidota bacterium]